MLTLIIVTTNPIKSMYNNTSGNSSSHNGWREIEDRNKQFQKNSDAFWQEQANRSAQISLHIAKVTGQRAPLNVDANAQMQHEIDRYNVQLKQ